MSRFYTGTGILILLASLLLSGCIKKKSKPAETASPVEQTLKIPDFSSDSAYRYIAEQLAFGPRVPGTPAHSRCALYLENKLRNFGWEVQVQKAKVRHWNDKILNISNIIGSINPENPDRILLCAHWDTREIADHDPDPANHDKPIPGANDGGSGVGVLLEVARQLSIENPGLGVDIVLFDAEDQGQPEGISPRREDTWCLGSQYWAGNPHKPGYRARFGILLDMVGAEGATFLKEEYSMYYAPQIVSLVWNMAARLGFSHIFLNRNGGGVTDDHYYVNEILKVPTINIIHQDMSGKSSFFEHWHTMNDDLSKIDRTILEAVGKTSLGVIYEQGNIRNKPV